MIVENLLRQTSWKTLNERISFSFRFYQALVKKHMIAKGLLDKFGKRNAKTPADWDENKETM